LQKQQGSLGLAGVARHFWWVLHWWWHGTWLSVFGLVLWGYESRFYCHYYYYYYY